MKYKARVSFSSKTISVGAGNEVELTEKEAKELVECGYLEPVSTAAKSSATRSETKEEGRRTVRRYED